MFGRRIRSIFDRLIPDRNKVRSTGKGQFQVRQFSPGDRIFFKNFQNGKSHWLEGVIKKKISTVVYIIENQAFTCKRHVNQIRPRTVHEEVESPMETLCDTFEIPNPSSSHEEMDVSPEPAIRTEQNSMTQENVQIRKSSRKKKGVKRLQPNHFLKRY